MQVLSVVLWFNHFTVRKELWKLVGVIIPGPFNKVFTPIMVELSLRSAYGSKIIPINSIMITTAQSLQLPITTGAGTSPFLCFLM